MRLAIGCLHRVFTCPSSALCTPELRSCVKVEVDVLGPPLLIVRTVSVDVKQH